MTKISKKRTLFPSFGGVRGGLIAISLAVLATVFTGCKKDHASKSWDISATAADKVTATFKNGTLTISGTGNMKDWGESGATWNDDGYADKIKTAVINTGVTNIGTAAFAYCTNLTSVTIPASVTSIGEAAFYNCPKLTAINVDAANAKYSSIDGVLFDKAAKTLIQFPGGKAGAYTIPNSVTVIENWAFEYCTVLTSITIPTSITSIGDLAFANCTGLTSIIAQKPTPLLSPAMGNGVFGGIKWANCVLKVPSASLALYYAAAVWKDFHTNNGGGGIVSM
jgi:hypothetical protein